MSDIDIAALRDRITNYRAVKWPSMSLPIDDVKTLLDAAEERDRLRAQRDALLAALEPIVGQLESAQRSTAPAFVKGFTMTDTASGSLLRAIAAAKKETP